MKRWLVSTPQFAKYCGGGEPDEYGADVIEIEAETARDAIRIGVREMLKDWQFRYCQDQRGDAACPYTGVKAETYEPEPDEMEVSL